MFGVDTIVLAVLIIFSAFYFESVFGFGGGLISIPLLAFVIGPRDAVMLTLVFQGLMGLILFKVFRDIQWKVVIPMTLTLIPATILGTLFLISVSDAIVAKVLAVVIFIFLVKFTLLREWRLKNDSHSLLGGMITGTIAGLSIGATGIGGPIMVMYLMPNVVNKVKFRASILYALFVVELTRVLVGINGGLFTPEITRMAWVILPFFLLALIFGQYSFKLLTQGQYRTIITLVLFVSAVSLFFG